MPRTSQAELPECPHFRALCCDSLGLIKVVDCDGPAGGPRVVARWGEPNLREGIRCASLSSDKPSKLGVARKTGTVEIVDCTSGALESRLSVSQDFVEASVRGDGEDSDGICGLHVLSKGNSKDTSVLTCTDSANVALRRFSNPGEAAQIDDNDSLIIAKWKVSESGRVLCMKVFSTEQYGAFGGKGVDVNVWDISNRTRLWNGKTPHRDSLGLTSPAWVTAVSFLRADDHRKVAVGTGHHQVRLYDIGAQRRPVLAFDYGEAPIKALAEDQDGNTVYVGTGGGDLASFDLRNGRMVGGFKGKCAGSIRAVVKHPLLPLIASCGLDRYLRIHNTKTRQLHASLFMKQQLVDVVFDDGQSVSGQDAASKSEVAVLQQVGGENGSTAAQRPVESRIDKTSTFNGSSGSKLRPKRNSTALGRAREKVQVANGRSKRQCPEA